MEKENYILLFLQIAAIAVSGVFGGDTTFALITALIGITFNFLVSMNIAPRKVKNGLKNLRISVITR